MNTRKIKILHFIRMIITALTLFSLLAMSVNFWHFMYDKGKIDYFIFWTMITFFILTILIQTIIEEKEPKPDDNTSLGFRPEKIEIQFPIKWETDSYTYPLKIKDGSGKTHYFNKNGTYDGFSIDTDINEN